MKKVIIIDNYDSFTYNLVHAVQEILGYDVAVVRNDVIDYTILDDMDYIILSPGPGVPEEAGDLKHIIKTYTPSKKILGVCLGHQAIGECFGAELKNLEKVYHGVQTSVTLLEDDPILNNVKEPLDVGRYHSWVIQRDTLTDDFTITSEDDSGEVMSMKHNTLPIYGVQFHPESILTPQGNLMLSNFLNI